MRSFNPTMMLTTLCVAGALMTGCQYDPEQTNTLPTLPPAIQEEQSPTTEKEIKEQRINDIVNAETRSDSEVENWKYPTDTLLPKDLRYVFHKELWNQKEVRFSYRARTDYEAYAGHMEESSRLAFDIETDGEDRVIRAPSFRGDKMTWKVRIGNMGNDMIGKYIKLTADNDFGFIIGHVSDWNVSDGQTVVTGQAIGLSGGRPNQPDQGVFIGNGHVHVEHTYKGIDIPYLEHRWYSPTEFYDGHLTQPDKNPPRDKRFYNDFN